MPVAQLGKPAWQRCDFEMPGKGCRVYAGRPSSCRQWSCAWRRQDKEFPADLRPDLCHVIFDPVPDVIYAVDETGKRHGAECAQLWVDPRHPKAHRAAAVREVIAAIAENHGMPTLARIGPGVGVVIFAPCLTGSDEWLEKFSSLDAECGDDPNSRVLALRQAGAG